MAFTILDTTKNRNKESISYNESFRHVIENHINFLRVSNVVVEDIPQHLFYRYEGNFYGYLTEIGVHQDMHWIYLRVNSMTNPNQFGKELSDPLSHTHAPYLIRVSDQEISTLQKYHLSRKF